MSELHAVDRHHRNFTISVLGRSSKVQWRSVVLAMVASAWACSPGSGESDVGAGGSPGSGGAPGGAGGVIGSGGDAVGSDGGAPSSGGVGVGGANAGGAPGSGGSGPGSGGAPSGGVSGDGGGSGSGGASSCVPKGKARNPLITHIFTADPNAVVYGDRIFLYVSHDVDGQEDYDMVDYRGFSSDDLVNWQDHGTLIHADSLPWAENLYAPGACSKGGKYYLYMPNGGDSIGVAVSDSPGGPFVDPLGESLITREIPGVEDVDWLFDPACFVDDDGQAYLYFGGGPEESGDNGRVMRLNDDMISLKDTSATTIVMPNFFEAMFVHKREGTYYLQYSSNFTPGNDASLQYMTSTSPTSGFTHRGAFLPNANINNGNNNHGSIVDFQGKTYLFYHARKLMQKLGTNKVNNRSVAVQELGYEADGRLKSTTMSTQDFTVDQIKCLDGFSEVEAETLAAEKGIEVLGTAGQTVRVGELDDGDWVGYSQVDFRDGATKLVLRVASAEGGGQIDVRVGGCGEFTGEPGTSIGTCEVPSTGGAQTYAELACTIAGPAGPQDLCLQFSGSPSFEIDSWHLE